VWVCVCEYWIGLDAKVVKRERKESNVSTGLMEEGEGEGEREGGGEEAVKEGSERASKGEGEALRYW
jgi:hypothetical protein